MRSDRWAVAAPERPDLGQHEPSRDQAGGLLTDTAPVPYRYLHAGEVIITKEPCVIGTILGSCVGVALHDRRGGYGGLNHFLLPRSPRNGKPSTRFGDVAMRKLLDGMLGLGSARQDLQAKVFGGARVLDYRNPPGRRDLGATNFDVAFEFLEAEGIGITGRDVGGRQGRKVIFHSHLGDAWVKRL